jgi:uncharacterized protein (DUF488 family)
LIYLLREILDITYVHETLLTPHQSDLKAYREKIISWDSYSNTYVQNLRSSDVVSFLKVKTWGARPALLCSEKEADFCHRRLAAEYLVTRLPEVKKIHHLGT